MNDRRRGCILKSTDTHKTRLRAKDPFDGAGRFKDRSRNDTAVHRRLEEDRGIVMAHNRSAKGCYCYLGFHSTEGDEVKIDVVTWGQVKPFNHWADVLQYCS